MMQTQRSERRSVQRMPAAADGLLVMKIASSGLVIEATVVNLSVLGVGLKTECELQPGTALVIDSSILHNHMAGLMVQVRHSAALSDGGWLLGCQFSRLLTTDDLTAFGNSQ